MNAMTKEPTHTKSVASELNTPVYDARALIPHGVHAKIVLDEQVYVLRITRAGKLILTK